MPNRQRRGVTLLLLALMMSIVGPLHAADESQRPSGWVLTLEWSPEYCHRHRASKERQCEEEHGFIVSRLRPRFVGTAPKCSQDPLPASLLDQAHLDIPNRELIRGMWSADGACSGLAPSEYVAQLGRAVRRIGIPAELQSVRGRIESDGQRLYQMLSRSNPEIPEEGVSARCEGRYLSEIRICLSENFEFGSCPGAAESDCPDEFLIRGAPEGRLRRPR